MAGVVTHHRGDRGEPGSDLALLGGEPPGPGGHQQGPQRARGGRSRAVPVHERRPVGVERADLRGRQRRQDRPPAGGQVRRQADPDVADQRGPAGGALLDDVEHVAAVQDREVGGLPHGVDELGQRAARHPLQRLLAGVAAAHLERRDAEPVAVFLGQVHHEALLDHDAEEVVGGRPGQADGVRDRLEGRGVGLAGEEAQHPERPGRGRDLSHAGTVVHSAWPSSHCAAKSGESLMSGPVAAEDGKERPPGRWRAHRTAAGSECAAPWEQHTCPTGPEPSSEP